MRCRNLLLRNTLTRAIKITHAINVTLFLQAIDKFYNGNANTPIKNSKDFNAYADESTSAARKEILGIFK